ncbi:protein RICE SALT SENSITIVE 3-like isoform X2 [Tasmannia lanceolata]
MLMWEDGFCQPREEEIDGEDPIRKAFSKMSIQLYNYGEGLMGKVASDKCHKWVFKEPSECEPNISNYWQSSFDALPSEWTDQFASGIQTVAVIQAGHGLLQLGSCKIIPEDLHFVLRMRHTFESLGYQSGFYLSQLFASNRSTSTPSSNPSKQIASNRPPLPIFNWSQRPLTSVTSTNFHNSTQITLPAKDDTQLFVLPSSSDTQIHDMITDHDSELKWPNGLSFFTALTGRTEDAKLLFGEEGLGNKPPQNPYSIGGNLFGNAENSKLALDPSNLHSHGNGIDSRATTANASKYLSLESHSNNVSKMEHKFKRSFTLPARMASSSSSSSMDHHQHDTEEDYRSSEAGIYSDIMETFLD